MTNQLAQAVKEAEYWFARWIEFNKAVINNSGPIDTRERQHILDKWAMAEAKARQIQDAECQASI